MFLVRYVNAFLIPSSALPFFVVSSGSCRYPLSTPYEIRDIIASLCGTDLRIFQILSVAVTLLWIIVACGTLRKLATGEILFAPCLKDLEGLKKERSEGHFAEKGA